MGARQRAPSVSIASAFGQSSEKAESSATTRVVSALRALFVCLRGPRPDGQDYFIPALRASFANRLPQVLPSILGLDLAQQLNLSRTANNAHTLTIVG